MTEKLYYEDGYLKSVDAEVIGVKKNGIILDKTIFYPEGGGQPGDTGYFGTYEITDTIKDDDGTPLHIIKGDLPSVGDKAVLTLSWNHRYQYMTEHSAQHLVSALLHSIYDIGTVAVHQGDGFFTIETDASSIDKEKLLDIEDKANEAIREGHGIEQKSLSREEALNLHMRRTIKVDDDTVLVVFIEGLDAVACGGVHLRNISEIKEIVYIGYEIIRGHVRTIWRAGDAAVSYRRMNDDIVSSLSVLLSSERENIVANAEALSKEKADLSHSVKVLSEKIAELEYKMEGNSDGVITINSSVPVSSFESVIPESDKRLIIVVDSSSRFLFHGDKEKFETLRSSIPSIKGGGRGNMYRGSVGMDGETFLREAERVLINDR